MLGGTLAAPTMALNLDGNNLRLPGEHRVKALRASASLDAGGNNATLVTDIEVSEVNSPALTLRSARVQSIGSRAAHQLTASASNDDFDASIQIKGAFSASGWRGTLESLRNRGRQAFALQAPVPVQIAGPASGGLAGLLQPERLSVGSAVLTLAGGNITLQQLEKNGPLWTTNGRASGIALTYLMPPSLLDTVRGDLTLGAAWSLRLQALSGKNDMSGMLRVFREKGDILVGGGSTGIPVALGLRILDARADVQGNALRLQANIDGVRAGTAKLDANTQLVQGRIGADSVLRASASATLPSLAALAPLAGQPGLDLGGTLALALNASGTIAAPALEGNITGEKLMVSWAEQGIKLNNGQLQAALAGDQLLLQRLRFEGGKGSALPMPKQACKSTCWPTNCKYWDDPTGR
jgi:translocation and assembly module TamB